MKTSKSKTKLSPQILEEASAWFVEFSEGNVGASGRAAFDTWLRRSPEHVQAYLQIAALWEDTSLLGKARTLGPDELIVRAVAEGNVIQLNPPSQEAQEEAQGSDKCSEPGSSSPSLRESERGERKSHRSRRGLLAIAATFLIAMIGAAAWYQLYRAPAYATEVGEQRSVRLSDGSTVEINSRSKLRVRFSEHERLVELLEGQAMFTVAKDPKRPFVVSSDETRVRAVGTRFDVYRRSSGTVVTVLEGRVAVGSPLIENRQAANSSGTGPTARDTSDPSDPSAGNAAIRNDSIVLAAGQRLTISPIALTAPEPANIEAATAWTRREIVFHASPLGEVVEEFNRYNPRKMVIADPELQSTRISGVFSSTDPNSLLRFLSDLPNFNIRETADEIRISSK